MPNIISFENAISDSEQYSKRHLLLGNGFSIGCRADIFHYESLFEEADFSGMPEAQQVFEVLQTQDFEIAIRALESGSKILPIYVSDDADDPDADYVVWQGETAAHSANVLFLHGALHLFDSGAELQKYTWVRKGEPLVDQARSAIAANKSPLFVAEGTSTQKKNKIRHNAYLYQCFKVLTANAQTGTHCFFVFGHSLADSDDHILKRLGKGHFKKLYVGIFGDADTPENREVIARANAMAALRHDRYPLEVVFYDSSSANVWGEAVNV